MVEAPTSRRRRLAILNLERVAELVKVFARAIVELQALPPEQMQLHCISNGRNQSLWTRLKAGGRTCCGKVVLVRETLQAKHCLEVLDINVLDDCLDVCRAFGKHELQDGLEVPTCESAPALHGR